MWKTIFVSKRDYQFEYHQFQSVNIFCFVESCYEWPSKPVLSNLVAICHMWRQTTVQIWISNDKYITCLTNYDKSGECGDRENMVGHHWSKLIDRRCLFRMRVFRKVLFRKNKQRLFRIQFRNESFEKLASYAVFCWELELELGTL
jgi:hypothetical protein